MITLNHVVHHGAIGHHVQNDHAYRGRREIGQVAAVDCASRIGMFLGGTMAEGWACYACDLMEEFGFLTPDESLAQQHTRARLLARAVADLALHRASITFDDAVALYRDRIGDVGRGGARRGVQELDVSRNGGDVLAGHARPSIASARDRERREGVAFSLRRFHDRLLSSARFPCR